MFSVMSASTQLQSVQEKSTNKNTTEWKLLLKPMHPKGADSPQRPEIQWEIADQWNTTRSILTKNSRFQRLKDFSASATFVFTETVLALSLIPRPHPLPGGVQGLDTRQCSSTGESETAKNLKLHTYANLARLHSVCGYMLPCVGLLSPPHAETTWEHGTACRAETGGIAGHPGRRRRVESTLYLLPSIATPLLASSLTSPRLLG